MTIEAYRGNGVDRTAESPSPDAVATERGQLELSGVAASRWTTAPPLGQRDPSPGEPYLSVVVPAYREGPKIRRSLDLLGSALDATGLSWEVVVVVDGNAGTLAEAGQIASDRIRVVGYPDNRGKGYALRTGLCQCRGRVVAFIDADMEIAPVGLGQMVTLLELYQADIVVGSKRHPLSQVAYPLFRRVQSSAFQLLLHALFRFDVRDTQTGLKVMRREVATAVAHAAQVSRFAFDVELLALARHFGFTRFMEAPVSIDYSFQTTTNPRAALRALWDAAAIFYRLRIRHAYSMPSLQEAPASGRLVSVGPSSR